MVITWYKHDKRFNSTKIPAGGTSISGETRGPISVVSPTIRVDITDNPNFVTLFNYAYIAAFNRYYYIVEYTYVSNLLVDVKLSSDPMSTNRNKIIAQKNMLSRASTKWNEHIPDMLQPTMANTTHETKIFEHDYARSIDGGTFVLGIIAPSVSGNSFGSVSYVMTNAANFASLCRQLYTNDDWVEQNVEELSPYLAKSVLNPMQYVVSAEWFPFPFGGSSAYLEAIGYFKLPVPMGCAPVPSSYGNTPVWVKHTDIPLHPQYTKGITDYLRMDNWSSYYLCLAPFGQLEIPCHVLYNQSRVQYELYVDYISGMGTITIYSDGDNGVRHVATTSAKISMSINLSQVINNGMANSLRDVTSIGGLVRGANTVIGDQLLGVMQNIADASGGRNPVDRAINGAVNLATLSRQASTVSGTQGGGGFGSLFVYGIGGMLEGEFVIVPGFLDLNTYGRPLVEWNSPQALGPGYYQISDPTLITDSTPGETAEAKRIMSGGFYYE